MSVDVLGRVPAEMDVVDPEGLARSDNYYGWAKIAYENLGFMFAAGKMHGGAKLSNVQIRIGGPRETDVGGVEVGDLRTLRRALGAYMSQRDLQQVRAHPSLASCRLLAS